MIKCTLFSKNIGYAAREFNDGDSQAIVLADAKKIKTVMNANTSYYYNAARVEMHKGMIKNGHFEIPLVVPRSEGLHWIEGFHQVNAAIESGMTVVPIGTSLAFAQQLVALVRADDHATTASSYDFSECEATVF